MLIRETNVEDRLERIKNIDTGEVFLFDAQTGWIPFHNKMVSKLVLNKSITYAVLIFEEGVLRAKAEKIAKKIGKAVEAFNRRVEIDIYFEVPRELFDMIRAECGV